MKKTLVLIVCLLISLCSFRLMADNFNNKEDALRTAVNYIDDAIKAKDKRWRDFKVEKIEKIYNSELKKLVIL